MAYIKREKYTVIDDNDLKKELLDKRNYISNYKKTLFAPNRGCVL